MEFGHNGVDSGKSGDPSGSGQEQQKWWVVEDGVEPDGYVTHRILIPGTGFVNDSLPITYDPKKAKQWGGFSFGGRLYPSAEAARNLFLPPRDGDRTG